MPDPTTPTVTPDKPVEIPPKATDKGFDFNAEIDKIATDPTAPKPPAQKPADRKPAAPKPPAPKPDDKKPVEKKPADKKATKPVEPPPEDDDYTVPDDEPTDDKPAEKPGEDDGAGEGDGEGNGSKPPEDKIETAPQLRQAYDKTKKRVAELEGELKKLRETPQNDEEREKLTKLLEAREKRLAELEEEMKFTAYEKSNEYKMKFDKPVVDAYMAGQAQAKTLKVTDPETGDERSGKPEDFVALMQTADDNEAAELAEKLFGNKAPMVLFHRMRVMELNANRLKALEEFKGTAKEREEKLQAEMAQKQEAQVKQQKALAELFHSSRDSAIEKYPELFKGIEGDEKVNELLTKGFNKVDLVFGKKGEKELTPEEKVKLHAMVRNKAGGFDALHLRFKRAQKRIAELEAKVQEFTGSQPNGGLERRGEKGKTFTASVEEEIDRLAAQNR